MKFIKVHNALNRPFYLNVDTIKSFETDIRYALHTIKSHKTYSMILLKDEKTLNVIETIEEIYSLIKGEK